jgi:septum formation protein
VSTLPPEPPTLILASASPRRRELIQVLGLPYEVVPSAYEEMLPATCDDPASLGIELAFGKALDVARAHPGRLVLGADTLVVLDTRIYGKPVDAGDAARMLRELSGCTHQVVTGVAVVVLRGEDVERYAFATTTDVTFRALHEREIEAYVATGEGLDKAGAYGIQHYGSLIIERVSGDYFNIVGLPLAPLAALLRGLGITILGLP